MAKVITDIETYNLSKTGEQIDSLLDEIGSKVTQTEINTAINNLRAAIDKELTALKNGAPEAMDSLGEIANALQNNPQIIEEVRNAITKESEDRASALTAERNARQQAVANEQNARAEAVQQEREGREAADRDINADIENLKKADAAINDKITDLVSGGVPDESIGAEKIEGVEFAEATKRENIATGETLKTLFGKIKKWFSDLKTVAWTGSYNDLTDTDSIATTEFVLQWIKALFDTTELSISVEYRKEDNGLGKWKITTATCGWGSVEYSSDEMSDEFDGIMGVRISVSENKKISIELSPSVTDSLSFSMQEDGADTKSVRLYIPKKMYVQQ